MASHPALIHPLPTDLMSMKAFDSTCMTIANHPGGGTTASSSSSSSRAAGVDNKYSAVAKHMVDTGKAGKVGCYFRPVCEVVPALVRRGQAVRGGYSWAEKVVVAKAKVYVGGKLMPPPPLWTWDVDVGWLIVCWRDRAGRGGPKPEIHGS